MLTIDKTKYPNKGKYIIGVSGGPDSMALMHFLIKEGYELVVCNVNYNTRDVSLEEQLMVKKECEKYEMVFESISVKYMHSDRNFEGWAREKRYLFFKDMYKKYKASGLFIAHHKNDDLETYILQKNRNNIVKYWGLAEQTQILGMNVIRPFLSYTKNELIEYCKDEGIPYSIDVTNFEPICERNRIRIDILDRYSAKDIDDFFSQKNEDNKKLDLQMKKVLPLLSKKEWEVKELDSLSEIEKIRFIYCLITNKIPSLSNKLSRRRIEDYINCLYSKKVNLNIKVNEEYYIFKSYGKFILSNKNSGNFVYILNEPGKLNVEEFSLDFTKDTSIIKVTKESYPLTIRNAQPNDIVTFGKVSKKVNRVMIDEKIPLYKRDTYPIVLDNKGKVVYFPLYNSDKQKNIANILSFVLK